MVRFHICFSAEHKDLDHKLGRESDSTHRANVFLFLCSTEPAYLAQQNNLLAPFLFLLLIPPRQAAPSITDGPAPAARETLSLFYHNLLANQLQMWHVMTIMRLDAT